jgi:uncharacterized protein (DUF2384 family)
LTGGELAAGGNPHRPAGSEVVCYRMAPEVAEHLVSAGLDPDFLGEIAGFSGLESRDVLDFAGIDRTTVSGRKASGSALAQDAAVKALQITDLLTQAIEVFGSPTQASTWLTRCCLADCFPASLSRCFVMSGGRSAGLGHRVSEVGG